jgi:tRNA (guanine-N7-)-methyltransferase
MNWETYYPNYNDSNRVKYADIGCGYGGLLLTLSEMYPSNLILFNAKLACSKTNFL